MVQVAIEEALEESIADRMDPFAPEWKRGLAVEIQRTTLAGQHGVHALQNAGGHGRLSLDRCVASERETDGLVDDYLKKREKVAVLMTIPSLPVPARLVHENRRSGITAVQVSRVGYSTNEEWALMEVFVPLHRGGRILFRREGEGWRVQTWCTAWWS